MKKRFTAVLFAVIMTVVCTLGLAACGDESSSSGKVSKLNGVYDGYLANCDDDDNVINLERMDGFEITIKDGKLTMTGMISGSADIKADGDGFSYTIPKESQESVGGTTARFEKVADGEYFCRLTWNYICKKGKKPSYPVYGEEEPEEPDDVEIDEENLVSDVVTKTEWLAAWDISDEDNITAVGSMIPDEECSEDLGSKAVITYKWDSNKHSCFQTVFDLPGFGDYTEGYYIEKVGDRFIHYERDFESGQWYKFEGAYELPITDALFGIDELIAEYFDDFTYSDSNKAYVGVCTPQGLSDVTVIVKIKDGKLRYVHIDGETPNFLGAVEQEFTFEYGNTHITLPADAIEEPSEAVTVELGVSVNSASVNYMQTVMALCDEFASKYSNKHVTLEINVTTSQGGVAVTSDLVLESTQGLYDSCVLQEDFVPQFKARKLSDKYASTVLSECSDYAAQTVAFDGAVYGFPVEADNTFFMWYDKNFFTADDVKSLDTMAQKAAAADKYIKLNYDNAWYNSAFFYGTGCSFDYGNDKNYFADIDGEKGKNAALGMMSLFGVSSPTKKTFYSDYVLKDDTVAYFGGYWDKETLPSNFAAAACPTFSADGDRYTLKPTMSSKAWVVNANSVYPEISEELAAYLSTATAQEKYFNAGNMFGIPTNIITLEKVRAHIEADESKKGIMLQCEQGVGNFFDQPASHWVELMSFGNAIYDGRCSAINLDEMLEQLNISLNTVV